MGKGHVTSLTNALAVFDYSNELIINSQLITRPLFLPYPHSYGVFGYSLQGEVSSNNHVTHVTQNNSTESVPVWESQSLVRFHRGHFEVDLLMKQEQIRLNVSHYLIKCSDMLELVCVIRLLG